MIEDDDKFKQKQSLDRVKPNRVVYILVFLAFILWTAALSYIYIPKIEAAFEKSGVTLLLEKMVERNNNSLRAVNTLYFNHTYAKAFTTITHKRGGSILHDTIESLIHDFNQEAVQLGYISLIDRKTRLIGLTSKNGICYVNLSKDFLNSKTFNKFSAYTQVERTLLLDSSIKKVVILVEGEVLDPNYFFTPSSSLVDS